MEIKTLADVIKFVNEYWEWNILMNLKIYSYEIGKDYNNDNFTSTGDF